MIRTLGASLGAPEVDHPLSDDEEAEELCGDVIAAFEALEFPDVVLPDRRDRGLP